MDLSCEAVSLSGLRHSGRLACILFQLDIGFLELVVENKDPLLLAHLGERQNDHVEDEYVDIDQVQNIQDPQKP